ncbi:MAG TPA: hypothetical protein VFA59_18205 [Vicinamibacterales bacterium]|nr:hypothetical protein [Vicinamibacterales bacterium]
MSEVHVMLEVAQALERLDDPAARHRVLHWLTQRYHNNIIATPPTGAASGPTAADPSLTVDSLTEFFPAGIDADDDQPRQAAIAAPSGVENMIRGFADDFRRFAREWQGA